MVEIMSLFHSKRWARSTMLLILPKICCLLLEQLSCLPWLWLSNATNPWSNISRRIATTIGRVCIKGVIIRAYHMLKLPLMHRTHKHILRKRVYVCLREILQLKQKQKRPILKRIRVQYSVEVCPENFRR